MTTTNKTQKNIQGYSQYLDIKQAKNNKTINNSDIKHDSYLRYLLKRKCNLKQCSVPTYLNTNTYVYPKYVFQIDDTVLATDTTLTKELAKITDIDESSETFTLLFFSSGNTVTTTYNDIIPYIIKKSSLSACTTNNPCVYNSMYSFNVPYVSQPNRILYCPILSFNPSTVGTNNVMQD